MNSLLDRLLAGPEGDAIWISDALGTIDGARLRGALLHVDTGDWQGKRVGLGEMPVVEFTATLAFLDGLAEAIVLLPAEDDASTRAARSAQAGIDVVLQGAGLGLASRLAKIDIDPTLTFERPPAIETTWLLPTSGTTGTPKLIAHTLASLTRSMSARRVGDGYTWGSLYSLRRFAGLQVLLQCGMGGTPLVLNEEHAELHEVLARFIAQGCNALSATPSMWRKLAMHPLFERLALKQITLGGEIVDQAILDTLAHRFPDARITHIYASTEAGVGFAVRDGRAGFPARYLSDPPSNMRMRVDERGHLMLAATGHDDWIDSGDVVEVDGDRIRFLGRANGSINVGGNKVMPEEIESVIKELPGIAFVQVRARRSAMLGSLVEAAITPLPGTEIDAAFRKSVTAHCRARLDGFKVPAFIVAADAVELTASGKLSRMRPA